MNDQCIEWKGYIAKSGYGKLSYRVGPRQPVAHRWAYEYFYGPVPLEMTIDHECHNRDMSCAGGHGCRHRRCINPLHLRMVTREQNVTNARRIGRKKICKTGHPLSGENLYVKPDGKHGCKTCRRENVRRMRARRAGNAAIA